MNKFELTVIYGISLVLAMVIMEILCSSELGLIKRFYVSIFMWKGCVT